MDGKFATSCRRCGTEFIVMSASAYLRDADDGADFTLHAATIQRPNQPLVAIVSPAGDYSCPDCGRHERASDNS